jgi:hypothetical protein
VISLDERGVATPPGGAAFIAFIAGALLVHCKPGILELGSEESPTRAAAMVVSATIYAEESRKPLP